MIEMKSNITLQNYDNSISMNKGLYIFLSLYFKKIVALQKCHIIF